MSPTLSDSCFINKEDPSLNDKEEDDYSKYSYLPIKYHSLDEYYQKQKLVVWFPTEIDFSEDRKDYEEASQQLRKYLEFNLAFWSQFDGLINENLVENFKKETSMYKEARNFYSAQEFVEVIHNETYSTLIEICIYDIEVKKKMFNAIKNYPSIKKMADWVFKWMRSQRPLTERVVAFACIEGIFFSSTFAGVYWIKKKNIMKGLCKANEWISRDEKLHTDFAIALYHVMTSPGELYDPLEQEKVHDIIKESCEVVEEFVRDALKVDMIGLNADDMVDYVKCTADKLSTDLGYAKVHNSVNPFDWMSVISLPNKSNFFETRPTEYARQVEADFRHDLDIDF